MIILSNTASQELAPGQSLTFNLKVLHTGRCECFRENSGAVMFAQRNAIYEIDIYDPSTVFHVVRVLEPIIEKEV